MKHGPTNVKYFVRHMCKRSGQISTQTERRTKTLRTIQTLNKFKYRARSPEV